MSHPCILHPWVAFSCESPARDEVLSSPLELAQGLLCLERDLELQRPGRLTIAGSVEPRQAVGTARFAGACE
jgi:hypothetical protein